jgi:hypothetical protein
MPRRTSTPPRAAGRTPPPHRADDEERSDDDAWRGAADSGAVRRVVAVADARVPLSVTADRSNALAMPNALAENVVGGQAAEAV